MAHDFSHLDKVAIRMFISEYCGLMLEHVTDKDVDAFFSDNHKHGSSSVYGASVKKAVQAASSAYLSALTPSDLAALLAEKCPGWKCVPVDLTEDMFEAVDDFMQFTDTAYEVYDAFLSAAPKLGDE